MALRLKGSRRHGLEVGLGLCVIIGFAGVVDPEYMIALQASEVRHPSGP
jgi:hypothetical protein